MKNNILTAFFFFAFSFTHAQVIQTVAGTGVAGYGGDSGPAILGILNAPYGVALDDTGNLYICDAYNRRIRKVSPARGGVITTIAGNGMPGYSGDGWLGIDAEIDGAIDIAVDHLGNIYIPNGNCVRKISPMDTITTIAGSDVAGFSGDNGPATLAQLNNVWGVTVDSIGDIYIADRDNNRIRRVDTFGIITTVAGTGARGFSPDGSLADTARLGLLGNIRIDKGGNLFISDSARIRKISPAVNGIITTIAGNGTYGYSGEGVMATTAEIRVGAIALDTLGNLFIADGECLVREVNTTGIINTIAGDGGGGSLGTEVIRCWLN